jgi:cytochrome c oxidase cbb3-type subunit 3
MSSRFRTEAVLILSLLAAGCQRQHDQAPLVEGGSDGVTVSGLVPAGGTTAPGLSRRALPYYDNAQAVATGRQLYNRFNCVGCHFNGGGGIGPALMDDTWIYGGRLDQIHASIEQGRPNGMPAWHGKLTDEQIWQIATYVRSMSLPATIAANSGTTPSQHPAPVPRAADMHDGWKLPEGSVVHTP